MPDSAVNPPPPQVSLEEAIDALLAEIDTTCARLEAPPKDEEDQALADLARAVEAANALAEARAAIAPETPDARPVAEAQTHADPIAQAEQALDAAAESADSLLEQAADELAAALAAPVETPTEPETEQDPASPEPASEPPDPDATAAMLDQAVADLFDPSSAAQAPTDDAPRPDPQPDPQPAASLDDLLEGSFESPDGETVNTAGLDTRPDPVLLLDQHAAPEPAPPGPAVPDPEPVAAAATEPATIPTNPPAALEPHPPREPLFRRAWLWIGPRLRPLAIAALRPLAPVAATAVMLLSKPLEGKPPKVRDSIGWVAIWTLFLAVCVWAYVLLRPPARIPNDGMGSAVVTAEPEAALPAP